MRNIGYGYKNFTLPKIKRFLKTGGTELIFTAPGENDFGEPTWSRTSEVHIWGIIHRLSSLAESASTSNSTETSKDSQTRASYRVNIFTSWENILGYTGGKELNSGMKILISDTQYRIIRCENLNNIGCEVYLEEYDGWN